MDGLFNVLSITNGGLTSNYKYTHPGSALTKATVGTTQSTYTLEQFKRTYSFDGVAGKNQSFGYIYNSNKMANWNNGTTAFTYSYDSRGNVTNFGKGTLGYNNQNNMVSATVNGQVFNYSYNALDERVGKTGPGVNRTFVYNENHQLIGEYENGYTVAEYIYLGATPIAVSQNGQLFFIHTDHLATPRAITSQGGVLVWKWDNTDPFGKNAPTNLGIDFNLRFMGQYFDNETGLFYNYYRYYNPETGRYMQSDPIGLKGGLDTYAYVDQNPLNKVDPLGLSPEDILKIKQKFRNSVDNMVAREERRPSNSWLPNNGFKNSKGKYFKECFEQTAQLASELGQGSYDDNWIFVDQSGLGHFWLVAVSSNPQDANVYMDPWSDSISVGSKCEKCSGMLGSNIDNLAKSIIGVPNNQFWFQNLNIPRPISKEQAKILTNKK